MASDLGKRNQRLVLELSDRLIFSVFDQLNEEQLRVARHFVQSNLKFHKYLDADSHKISRHYEGLCAKFAAHSQHYRSEALRYLVSRFLDLSARREDRYQKDEQWSILSFLSLLSVSPLNAPQHVVSLRVPSHHEQAREEEALRRELLQELELGMRDGTIEHGADDLSDWSDDDDCGTSPLPSPVSAHAADPCALQSALQELFPLPERPNPLEKKLYRPSDNKLPLLLYSRGYGPSCESARIVAAPENVEPESAAAENAAAASSLRELLEAPHKTEQAWREHRRQGSELQHEASYTTVSEQVIVRETMWMLLGCTVSAYTIHNALYQPNENFVVSHTSPGALANLQRLFSNFGNCLNFLRRKSAWLLQQQAPTLQAVGRSLELALMEFASMVTKMEKSPPTLLRLESLLQRPRRTFEEVARVLAAVVTTELEQLPSRCRSNSKCVSALLSSLQSALSSDIMVERQLENPELFTLLFVDALEPMMEKLELWMQQGVLHDAEEEFLVIPRVGDATARPRRTPKETGEPPEGMVVDSFAEWQTKFSPRILDAEGTHTSTTLTDGLLYNPHLVPTLLKPYIRKILVAGKNADLLRQLGCLDLSACRTGLFSTLRQSVVTGDLAEDLFDTKVQLDPMTELQQQDITSSQMDQCDVLLEMNLDTLFEHPFHSRPQRLRAVHGPLPDLTARLGAFIDSVYQASSRRLMTHLWTKCQLAEHLAVMRGHFLMEAGNSMHHVCTALFESLAHGGLDRSPAVLHTVFRFALRESAASDLCENLWLVCGENQTLVTSVEALSLHYHAPFPVDIVLHRAIQEQYNQVFRFVLRLKQGLWAIDSLPSKELESLRKLCNVHKLYLLRNKILQCVHGIYNYFMTRILHSLGKAFAAQVLRAQDLDQLLAWHQQYMNEVRERCMLHEGVAMVKDAIDRIIESAQKYRSLVHGILYPASAQQPVTEREFAALESDFNKCEKFLCSLLLSQARRGAYPHLESLAIALGATDRIKPTIWN
eukprot:m.76845 g.76845  ORF g.76845 m.76845 type:complete len:1000 (+) comp17250_c0_seq4:44-3043(+)